MDGAASQDGGVAEDGAGQGWHRIDLGGRAARRASLGSSDPPRSRTAVSMASRNSGLPPARSTRVLDVVGSQRGGRRRVDDQIGCGWRRRADPARSGARPRAGSRDPSPGRRADDATASRARRAAVEMPVRAGGPTRRPSSGRPRPPGSPGPGHEAAGRARIDDLSGPVGSELRVDRLGLWRRIDLEVADRRHERQHRSQVGREARRSCARAGAVSGVSTSLRRPSSVRAASRMARYGLARASGSPRQREGRNGAAGQRLAHQSALPDARVAHHVDDVADAGRPSRGRRPPTRAAASSPPAERELGDRVGPRRRPISSPTT